MKTWLVTVILYSLCLFFTPSAFSGDKIYFGYLDGERENPFYGYYEQGKFVAFDPYKGEFNMKTHSFDHPDTVKFFERYRKLKNFTGVGAFGSRYALTLKKAELPTLGMGQSLLQMEVKNKSLSTELFANFLLFWSPNIKINVIIPSKIAPEKPVRDLIIKRINSFYQEVASKSRDRVTWGVSSLTRLFVSKASVKPIIMANIEKKSWSGEHVHSTIRTAFFHIG